MDKNTILTIYDDDNGEVLHITSYSSGAFSCISENEEYRLLSTNEVKHMLTNKNDIFKIWDALEA